MGLTTFWSVLMHLICLSDTDIYKENAKALLGASEEGGRETSAEKRGYAFVSRLQTARRNDAV
jgi:hypothetical protein